MAKKTATEELFEGTAEAAALHTGTAAAAAEQPKEPVFHKVQSNSIGFDRIENFDGEGTTLTAWFTGSVHPEGFDNPLFTFQEYGTGDTVAVSMYHEIEKFLNARAEQQQPDDYSDSLYQITFVEKVKAAKGSVKKFRFERASFSRTA